ncbi:MAG: ferrochelatase [Rhodobacteraceae bacterium]|nr:ferrochelatase [Paracoccaceae bacterium]
MEPSSPTTDKIRPPQAPADHPPIAQGKIGVLLANLGTPDHYGYWPMRRYLGEFLSDKRVIDYPWWKWQPILQTIILTKRPFSSGAAYKSIWNHDKGESPLLTITKAQTARLRSALAVRYPQRLVVDFCMRYGNPPTIATAQKMVEAGCQRLLFFPLYPHYAGATTATANDQFFRALMQMPWQPAVRTVGPYFDHPAYISALAASVREGFAALDWQPDRLVVSYHGMPLRYLRQGDPYHCQCQKTTRLLREHLGWAEEALITTFQSRFGPEEWLQPYTVEEVARLAQAGQRRIALIAPAFSADCIETLEEICEEIKESFLAAGGERFSYIPCLNEADAHIEALATLIEENLRGWLG